MGGMGGSSWGVDILHVHSEPDAGEGGGRGRGRRGRGSKGEADRDPQRMLSFSYVSHPPTERSLVGGIHRQNLSVSVFSVRRGNLRSNAAVLGTRLLYGALMLAGLQTWRLASGESGEADRRFVMTDVQLFSCYLVRPSASASSCPGAQNVRTDSRGDMLSVEDSKWFGLWRCGGGAPEDLGKIRVSRAHSRSGTPCVQLTR